MRTAIAILASIGTGAVVHAQGFNVDYGSMFDPTAPSEAYGGAAEQPGVWNDLPGFEFVPIPLVDIAGDATGVTVLDAAGNAPFGFPNPDTEGDDGALMDDALDLGGDSQDVFVIEGLAPGTYDVFTYAWAPDSPSYVTGVSVNGQGEQLVGGDWQGEQKLGFSYALHTVEIGEGEPIEIATSTFIGFATLNGFQIRPVGGCGADCNGDGELNVLDFVCFQDRWVSQDPAGDCDGNGLFDVLDFVCFQGLFVAGCP